MSRGGKWIEFSADINRPTQVQVHGAAAAEALSPYDVPQAFRIAQGSEDAKTFVIEFKYMASDEPTSELILKEDVSAFVGKSSGRVYRFVVSGLKTGKDRKATFAYERLKTAARELIQRASPSSRRIGNYKLARDVLDKEGEQAIKAAAIV